MTGDVTLIVSVTRWPYGDINKPLLLLFRHIWQR